MKKYLALLLVAAAVFGGILAFMDQDGDPGHGGSNPPAAGSGGAGGGGSNEIQAGVQRVHILDGRIPHSQLLEFFTNKGIGTAIIGDTEQRFYEKEKKD